VTQFLHRGNVEQDRLFTVEIEASRELALAGGANFALYNMGSAALSTLHPFEAITLTVHSPILRDIHDLQFLVFYALRLQLSKILLGERSQNLSKALFSAQKAFQKHATWIFSQKIFHQKLARVGRLTSNVLYMERSTRLEKWRFSPPIPPT
jgi:hypothetical protein